MGLASPRSSRFIIIIFFFLLLTFLYLHQYDVLPQDSSHSSSSPTHSSYHSSSDLPARIAYSEKKYQKVLESRQELIRKYGPSPSQVVMFPPDQDPWPAYTAWDFFPPAFQCPHEVERIGSLGDGGKWLCGLSRLEHKRDCVVYVFGIDWDSSFEAEILSRTQHCEIWGYDAAQHRFGHLVPSLLSRRTHFARYQLGPRDSHGDEDDPKVWTLESLMKLNGHTHIDILKIDIEGWEFDTLRALLSPYLPALDSESPSSSSSPPSAPFGQLQIEVHAWNKKFHDFLNWWEVIEGAGLRPFMFEPNLVYVNYNRQSGAELADYSFINIRGNNVFVSDSQYTSSEHEAVAGQQQHRQLDSHVEDHGDDEMRENAVQ